MATPPALVSVSTPAAPVADTHSEALSAAPPAPRSAIVAVAAAMSSTAVHAPAAPPPASCGDDTTSRSSVRPTVMTQDGPGQSGKPR